MVKYTYKCIYIALVSQYQEALMKNKYFSTVLVSLAIAFTAIPGTAEEEKTPEDLNSAFVCATQSKTPTLYAYNPGQVNLKPLMSWHGEYLLPGQSGVQICQKTATKLQNSYQQKEAQYLKSTTTTDTNVVCLVNEEDQNCVSEESQKLFSVNAKYNASCVLENKSPIQCTAVQVSRGIYSFNDEPYQPLWWPW